MDVGTMLTALISDKRRYKRYKTRVAALPPGYRDAVGALERYLFVFGPGKGEAIQTMLDDLADLVEQSAASGTSVREVVGDDPVEFAETFVRNYDGSGWIAKERARLVDAIDRIDEAGPQ